MSRSILVLALGLVLSGTGTVAAQESTRSAALPAQPPLDGSTVDGNSTARAALRTRELAEQRIDPRIVRDLQLSSVAADRSLVTDRVVATADLLPAPSTDPSLPASDDSLALPDTAIDPDPIAAPQVTLDLSRVSRRVGDLKSTSLFNQGVPVSIPPETTHLALEPGQILAVSRNEPAAKVTVQGITMSSSPSVLYTLDRQLRTRELGLVHKTAGLAWNSEKGRFMGQILVGIVDRENVGASEPIDAAVPVQLLAAGNAVSPASLMIRQIGQPFATIDVMLEDPKDPFEVQLLSQVDPDLPPARLPVQRTRLVLSAPTVLDGLGVGFGEITVLSAGARLREGEAITLNLDNGRLDTSTLIADRNGIATTRIRSTGLGAGTLRLAAGPYLADPVRLNYAPPWLLITATLLGSLLGTFIMVYALKQRQRRRRNHFPDAVAGLVIGIGATSMVYAGMALPEWVPLPQSLAGAIAPFALSFFCATAGSALIGAFTGMTSSPNAEPIRI